ncbi:hypothetical protein [Ereboglobus sp. PH5-10]|uniref:hypothetical protein n=1 Tax=Ereboglobus sp. PH5-10 TaxID=2940629 RepID=UPI001374EB21|nr:hypothetical protein [Ereboglobus sp. PH5-10]
MLGAAKYTQPDWNNSAARIFLEGTVSRRLARGEAVINLPFRMQAEPIASWQIWGTLRAARMPLGLILIPDRVETRAQMTEYSDSAYVYRMFDLVFGIRSPGVFAYLTEKEKKALNDFSAAYAALPWQPLALHPHISELVDGDFSPVIPAAKRLDRLLALRTGRGPVSATYRLAHGWPLRVPIQPTERGLGQ